MDIGNIFQDEALKLVRTFILQQAWPYAKRVIKPLLFTTLLPITLLYILTTHSLAIFLDKVGITKLTEEARQAWFQCIVIVTCLYALRQASKQGKLRVRTAIVEGTAQ